MSAIAYVDTSALLKRFVREQGTDDMVAFVAKGEFELAISTLTVTEFRSSMKRRLRLGLVSQLSVNKATEQLLKEIASNALIFHTIETATFNLASELIENLTAPLATLDSLHLASAKACGASLMVSADKQLLRASTEANLDILDFSSPKL